MAKQLPIQGVFHTTTGTLLGIAESGAGSETTLTIITAAGSEANGMSAGQLAGMKAGTKAKATIQPSGDTTGAKDYAAIAPYLASGQSIALTDGDYYFNNTLVRMPSRNAAGTDWNYGNPLGRSTDALLPDFTGSGSERCRLNFTDSAKPGMYIWRAPSGISGGPTTNVRVRANAADISNDPLTAGGGTTSGFSIIGAAVPVTVAGGLFGLDNEAMWPNHIGIAAWGSINYHDFKDIQVKNFGTGITLHDVTGAKFSKVIVRACDVGWGMGIQSDAGIYDQCWTEFCRVGTAFVWEGWQTGSGRAATFAGIGRESAGTYIAYGTSDNDCNTFRSCFWTGCAMAALAGHSNPANTQNVDFYEANFQSCYWESNGSIMMGFRNAGQGGFSFRDCNFRGLCSTDTVGSYTFNGTQTGPIQEILRHWIVDRIGVSQNTADANFGSFWTYGGGSSVGMLCFENCRFDATPYPIVFAPGSLAVRWEHCWSPLSGVNSYPTIYANLNNAQKGCRVNSATFGWNSANSQDWGDYFLQAGFVKNAQGVMTGITTAVTLPTAAATYRGHTRTIIGASGTTDTTYQCMKAAADTYSWVAVGNGG